MIPLRSPLGLESAYLGFPFWAMTHVLSDNFVNDIVVYPSFFLG